VQSSRFTTFLSCQKTVLTITESDFSSTADTGKMSVHSRSGSSSNQSISVPVATAQLDLEKTTSKAVQDSPRSRRPDKVIRTAEDWDGPDDPDNPLNWPTPKKIFHTLIPALQCFTVTFGSSVYVSSKHLSLSLCFSLTGQYRRPGSLSSF